LVTAGGLEEKMQLVQLMREQMWVKDGDLLDREGKYEEALSSYDHALQIDPGDADVWFDKGQTLKKMGKNAEAEKCIETAINLYCGR
jgi:tetratricopeptide (TPR) repeat protein